MKTIQTSLLTSVFLLSTAFCTLAAKPGWTENFDQAQKKASAEQKPMLLDFTGSDWCGWCIKIDKEVFAKPEFKSFSEKSLVLVELDFPQGKTLPDAVKAQNSDLQRKFKVNGYPTLVLLSPAGKEITRWEGFKPTFLEELKKAAGEK
ncbi:MAG: thioredoxin family protein [Verrucomicrobiota bacterium]